MLSSFDVRELLEFGYTFVDVSQTKVENARREYLTLTKTYGQRPHEQREFTRDGEDSPDLGIIYNDDEDLKYFFHYANDWAHYTQPPFKCLPLPAIKGLYESNNQLALQIVKALSSEYRMLFRKELVHQVAKASHESITYGTNVLRGLYYPSRAGTRAQVGASSHYDRSFLTIHLGDQGGELIAYQDESDEVGTVISPKAGQAVVFFGVKAAMATRNLVKPLWHGSRTEPEQERFAMTHFVHNDVGFPVSAANKDYRQFCQSLGQQV